MYVNITAVEPRYFSGAGGRKKEYFPQNLYISKTDPHLSLFPSLKSIKCSWKYIKPISTSFQREHTVSLPLPAK